MHRHRVERAGFCCAPGLRLVARRERPGCLRIQGGLSRWGCGRRGRGLGRLFGWSSFLCRGLGGSGLLCSGRFFCRRCSLLRRCCLLGRYGLLGGSGGLLCRCCSLFRRCCLLRCYCLLGGSGFLCRCCCLLGRCSLLRCYWFCRCSFFRWGRLLSGWFFRSCHHVLLGSICKEHFLSAVDRKRSMEMEKNSISMNTGTPPVVAHLCAAEAGGVV